MKKLLILLLLALVCTGCTNKDGRTENVVAPSENVYDAEEESAVIASEEPPKEDGGDDIAVGAELEQPCDVEETIIEDESVPTEVIAAEQTVEIVEAATTTEENKLCIGLAKEI